MVKVQNQNRKCGGWPCKYLVTYNLSLPVYDTTITFTLGLIQVYYENRFRTTVETKAVRYYF